MKSDSGSNVAGKKSVITPCWRPFRRSWIQAARNFFMSVILSKSSGVSGLILDASMISDLAISHVEKSFLTA